MTILAILLTVTAGVFMGAINNLAGGAGVIGLMAFEYACGLPYATANPSLRLAAVTIGVFSFLGYLRAGKRVPMRVWWLGMWAVPGAPLGSWLALYVPELAFWLYLGVALALLLRQQLRPMKLGPMHAHPHWHIALGCFLIGVHMGYAQVGVGLLTTLVLTATYDRDLVAVTAAKSALVVMTSITSVTTFASAGAIAWQPALWLALGTGTGAYLISHWAVAKGATAVRKVVLGITALTLVYVLQHIWVLLV